MAAEGPSGHARPDRNAPSLLYAIKQVELAVRSHLDDLLRPAGLTTTQYTALTVLERRDGMSAAQLARNSFVTAQSMQDVVSALLAQELIVRRPDPTNRRRLLIIITDKGRKILDDLTEPVYALDRRMTQALDDAGRDSLRQGLDACRAALTTHAE